MNKERQTEIQKERQTDIQKKERKEEKRTERKKDEQRKTDRHIEVKEERKTHRKNERLHSFHFANSRCFKLVHSNQDQIIYEILHEQAQTHQYNFQCWQNSHVGEGLEERISVLWL